MRLFALLAAILVCAAPAYGYGQTPHISSTSIEFRQASFVKIGGIEQWIDVRGKNPANPLLLVLHGGPGSTWDPLEKLFEPWEAYFTLVEWDQRGAGRTYAKNGPASANITIDRVVSDGIEVAEYLHRQFPDRKLILLGHSWGSLIGIRMVAARPDLFSAYVGTGQEVTKQRAAILNYAEVLRRARAARNAEAEKALVGIGPPPYKSAHDFGIEQRWENTFVVKPEEKFNSIDYVRSLYPPDFSDKDMADRMAGSQASYRSVYGDNLNGPMLSINLLANSAVFRVPVFFIQGEMDDVTPTSLVREYVRPSAHRASRSR